MVMCVLSYSVMDYTAAIHIIDCFLIDGSKVCVNKYMLVNKCLRVCAFVCVCVCVCVYVHAHIWMCQCFESNST